MLLDRVSLSKKNGWIDESGKVFVYFTIETVKRSMRCANSKACALMKELVDFGLIERRKRGLGKPAVIYVKDFARFQISELQASEYPDTPKRLGLLKSGQIVLKSTDTKVHSQ